MQEIGLCHNLFYLHDDMYFNLIFAMSDAVRYLAYASQDGESRVFLMYLLSILFINA